LKFQKCWSVFLQCGLNVVFYTVCHIYDTIIHGLVFGAGDLVVFPFEKKGRQMVLLPHYHLQLCQLGGTAGRNMSQMGLDLGSLP
jgi:hypothetical protein